MPKYSYRFSGASFTGQKYTYTGPSSAPCRKILGPSNIEMDEHENWFLTQNNSYVYGKNHGFFAGGATDGTAPNIPTYNIIDCITINITSSATDFGDLSQKRMQLASCASLEYGVFAGGYDGGSTQGLSTIDYISFDSGGSASSFGSLSDLFYGITGCSSQTRGIFAGGSNSEYTVSSSISYITISIPSDTSEFGYLSSNRGKYGYMSMSSCSSPIVGVFNGGGTNLHETSIIDYITISTLGNAQDFGDLTGELYWTGSCSSSSRGLIFGGTSHLGYSNDISYITFSNHGNSQNFGELSFGAHGESYGCSSQIRGMFKSNNYDQIQYVEFSTLGNSSNFGSLSFSRVSLTSCSDCHGGLS